MTLEPRLRHLPFVLVACLGPAAEGSADLVFLRTGAVVSVRAHRLDGNQITLVLRGGGEASFDASLVDRITPDEVPQETDAARIAGGASPEPAAQPAFVPSVAAARYAQLISTVSAAHGVDPALVHAVVEVESNYQPRARSPKGARGLMQLMPATARQYSVRNMYDPQSNLEAGVRHLRSLLARFELPLALAAYNAGEAAIRRYKGIPPYPETQSYVRRILARVGR